VSPALVQREAALAAVALVAALVTLAFADTPPEQASDTTEQSVPLASGGWYEAVAGSYRPRRYGRLTACGVKLEPGTKGIVHPVLPCGAKIFVLYAGTRIEAPVVDKGLPRAGDDFDLTAALASELALEGTRHVRWRFAGS
jgi:hypothetical protein